MTLQQLRYVLMVADKQSMNQAAQALFISQPSLSAAVRELEEEIGVTIFARSNKGITVTAAGNEFLGYARQLMAQYALIDARYLSGTPVRKRFSVSMQHYSFAVQAFIRLVERFGMDEYEFAVHETKTYEVIENVARFHSEIGVLYRNAFNEQVLTKLLRDKGLVFTPLFDCAPFVYLWKGHPLAAQPRIHLDDLAEYPCLSFGQGGLTVTPLQVTAMFNAIASGGVYHSPCIVSSITGGTQVPQQPQPAAACSPAVARVLQSMLATVVRSGIGGDAQPHTGTAAGKTGTAQTGQFDADGRELLHYWFAGFYPADAPRYTITVLQDSQQKPQTSSAALFAQVADALAVLDAAITEKPAENS